MPSRETRLITHRLSLVGHLRFCPLEQRFRVPLPEDAGRADAGAAQPREEAGRGLTSPAVAGADRADSAESSTVVG
jgi:hypothetical protein